MIYPAIPDLLEKVNSRYMLVNVVARRARDIAVIADENEEALEVKPVTAAMEDICSGKVVPHFKTKQSKNAVLKQQ